MSPTKQSFIYTFIPRKKQFMEKGTNDKYYFHKRYAKCFIIKKNHTQV